MTTPTKSDCEKLFFPVFLLINLAKKWEIHGANPRQSPKISIWKQSFTISARQTTQISTEDSLLLSQHVHSPKSVQSCPSLLSPQSSYKIQKFFFFISLYLVQQSNRLNVCYCLLSLLYNILNTILCWIVICENLVQQSSDFKVFWNLIGISWNPVQQSNWDNIYPCYSVIFIQQYNSYKIQVFFFLFLLYWSNSPTSWMYVIVFGLSCTTG